MTDLEFDKCIEDMLNQDKDGLKRIYQAYNPVIYHSILAVIKNRHIAEDITSEFFIKIWKIAPTYKLGGAHKKWLITIAHNMAIDYMRKYQKEELYDDMPDKDSGDRFEEEIDAKVSMEETLNTLDKVEREIINLKVLAQYTFKDISSELDMPMGTVTWKYQEAIKKLRRCKYE